MIDKIFLEVKRALEYKGRALIAIDGRAGAGKSTLASELAELFDGEIISMDDFFLPMELRTEERLNEPGGNVHYERFAQEVGLKLIYPMPFEYGVFNCSEMRIDSKKRVKNGRIVIVEGSYSLRPEFRDIYDVRIFMDVDADTQMKRIKERNGEELAKRFEQLWIPLEEKYFEAFKVKECVDVILKR